MNSINTLFKNISELQKYAPGLIAQANIDSFSSHAISAKKQIINIITLDIWNEIVSEIDTEALYTLKNALANLMMNKANVFEVVEDRRSGNDAVNIYKHEQETMRRLYLDNYFSAMDSLLQIISEKETYSVLWKKTPYFSILEKLQVKTTSEFHSFYGIDMSYLFFFRTISLQRELLLDGLSESFEKAKEDKDLTERLKLALTQLVIALALTRFDIIELPATIRSLFDEQKSSRSGDREQERILKLAQELRNNALTNISAVEMLLNNSDNSNIISDTSINKPDDKIFLMV